MRRPAATQATGNWPSGHAVERSCIMDNTAENAKIRVINSDLVIE